MIAHLRIKNLALVADLELDLQPGFNVVTGETGAGKSILIGALNLLLGQRADRTLLRAGADACTVEAVVDIRGVRAPIASFLAERGLEPCDGGQLFLKRTFAASGANRQFVNGSPAPLQTLAELGEWLVDIHGPHDHQSLFQPAHQLELLDAYAELGEARTAFALAFDRRAAIETARLALADGERALARQIDLLRHQVREIDEARFQPGDEETLEADLRRAQNAARLIEASQTALGLLAAEDDSLLARAGQLGRVFHELARLDPGTSNLAALHEQGTGLFRDLQSALGEYADRVELDPARLQELEDRVNLLHALRRKYGATVADILAAGEAARTELDRLEGRDAELARLDAEMASVDAGLVRLGEALAKARRQAVPRLGRAVGGQLRDLGFRQSRFDVELRRLERPQRSGFDAAEFQFAPNPGEPARPLRAIASSGELARVMLAVKTVLAAQDDIPVLVFDEVDANVGGETAHAVGDKMRQIAKRRQVLCITHLAPVAAAATSHLVVTKGARQGRTITDIAPIEGEERVAELARMLGGGDAARQHAAALVVDRSA